MVTKQQMVEALHFLENAYAKYNLNKDGAISLARNYMLGHNELNNFLMQKDLVYCGFMKYGWMEADFNSALRTLRNEIEKL